MIFLERVILPRRCVLVRAGGLPSFRSPTFGVTKLGAGYGLRARNVRFEK
jgi:hypothetical protein